MLSAFQFKNHWSLLKTSAGWLANAQQNGPFVGYGLGSFFYSTNQGATWNPIPNAGGKYNNAGRTTLAVATSRESTVYAFAADVLGVDQRDLFKSTDGGLNWKALNITNKTPTNPAFIFQPDMNLMSGQSFFDRGYKAECNSGIAAATATLGL
jgi:BNR/Asp-box repeat protein